MNKFLSIQDAAKSLGVSPQTLRRWERKKKIAPVHRTQRGQRRYSAAQLKPFDSLKSRVYTSRNSTMDFSAGSKRLKSIP